MGLPAASVYAGERCRFGHFPMGRVNVSGLGDLPDWVRFLEGALQELPAAILVADAPSGRLLLATDHVKRLWRQPFLPAARIEESDQYRGFHADGRPYRHAEWPLARSVRTGEVVTAEPIAVLRGDGTRGLFQVSAIPVRDETGGILAAATFFHEGASREEIETGLREAGTLIRAAMRGAAALGRPPDAAGGPPRADLETRLAREQATRAEAEASVEQLRRLQRVTDAALARLELHEVPRRLLRRVRQALDADTATVLRLDEVRGELVMLDSDGLREDVGEHTRVPLDRGVAASIAARRQPLIVEDLSQVEVVSSFLKTRVKSLLGAPLVVEDRVIGVVHVGTIEPRRFSRADVELMQLVADRLALVVQQARLHARERAARAEAEAASREARILAELNRAISMALSLDEVLQRVTEGAKEVCGSDWAHISLRDGEADALVVRYEIGALQPLAGTLRIEAGKGMEGEVLVTGRPFRTEDYAADPRIDPSYLDEARRQGVVAQLAVPILLDDRVAGVLCVGLRTRRPFTERDEAVLGRLADHAAIAIRNVQLFAREHAARADAETAQRRAEFLARAGTILASSLDYKTTLGSVAELSVPILGDWYLVHLVQEDRSLRRVAIAHADPAAVQLAWEVERRYPIRADDPHGPGRVLRTGQAVLIPEISDARLAAAARDPEHLELLRRLGLVSYICVPLTAGGRTLGTITLATAASGRRYTERDVALAEDLGRRAALAVDNARLYAEAQRANRAKDQFLAMLGHELRNPLGAIRSAMAVVLRRLRSDDAPLQQMGEIIARQSQHLARLVDDLLDVARVTSGKITLERRPVDLLEVAARAVASLEASGRGGSHDIRIVGPSLSVEGDPTRLAQVVGNLLDNAVKYTPSGGRVTVGVAKEEGQAVVRVTDSGAGISPEMLARIFDLFVQERESIDRSQGGLGLGLALVRRLVEMHGGTVQAMSRGPDTGSEFAIRLPLLSATASGMPAPTAPPAPASRHVLLVEDNEDARDALRAALELDGHHVDVAEDGETGLTKLLMLRPEVALIDIGLPRRDGYALARAVRATPGTEGIRLVAVTGYGQPEDRRRAFEAGFQAHLIKPVDPQELARVLADAPESAA